MWNQLVEAIQKLLGRIPAPTQDEDPRIAWQVQWEEARAQRRAAREAQRHQRRAADRRHFGEETWGVAKTQRGATADAAKLARFGLPLLRNEAELAAWLGISLTRLRWFSYDRPADRVSHYVYRHVPKRSGGQRLIMAPKRELKALQRTVLHELLEKVPAAAEAHGFLKGRSIVSNAQPHVGQPVLLNLDLKDFFPSITYPRVRGVFISLGYGYAVAAALAMLCTEAEREEFDHNGERYFISVGQRCLPQGAPTSPALANMAAWRLDLRLAGLARARGWRYTRYADDLTFSGSEVDDAHRILAAAKQIIAAERFTVHPEKIHIARQSGRQLVTGLVVNDAVGTPRELRRRVRAILHQARSTGLEAQNREGHENFRAYLHGLIGYIAAANPQHAEALRVALRELQ